MDIEKVFKDFNWHPEDGDYGTSPDDERLAKNKEKFKKNKINKNGKIYRSRLFLITIILIGIFILK